MAEEVGFEPTDGSHRQTISSRSRYDHFDTPPYMRAGHGWPSVPVAMDGVKGPPKTRLSDYKITLISAQSLEE